MVKPTIGRVVLFNQGPASEIPVKLSNNDERFKGCEQPRAATVANVNDDGSLNLSVLDALGNAHPRTGVPFVEDGETVPGGMYCTWPTRD